MLYKIITIFSLTNFASRFKFQIKACDKYGINILKPSDHYMYHQFNIQQLYALSTLYLCVLCGSENKQRLVTLTA